MNRKGSANLATLCRLITTLLCSRARTAQQDHQDACSHRRAALFLSAHASPGHTGAQKSHHFPLQGAADLWGWLTFGPGVIGELITSWAGLGGMERKQNSCLLEGRESGSPPNLKTMPEAQCFLGNREEMPGSLAEWWHGERRFRNVLALWL